ncbi:MAG: hypothetical protein JWP30_1176 [Homoserinimonas sp.]|jgi:D-inositol-3-phosphate glycosyltransferase|nr:hypothetical protein [Homoserinimonas sp.]
MAGKLRRVGFVSMHTSPVHQAGTGDSGGLNVALMSTASALAACDVEVDLITRATGEPRVTPVAQGVTLHELPAGAASVLRKENLVALADEFGEAVAALTGRNAPRYDIIHAHYWLSGLATLPVAIELGIPFVQSFHTLGAMKNKHRSRGEAPEPEGRLRSESYLAAQANAVVAGSRAEVETLIDDVGCPADRVWVIPPGVDVDLFRPDRSDAADRVRKRYGIAAGRPIVAMVGRVQPLKDQELSIRALSALNWLRGWAPALVIAGDSTPGDEPYLASLRQLAHDLGVADDVRFVGAQSREQLADLLSVASITLMPSRSETFGLVALESAASGTPVIGYRGTGLVESVAEGKSGLLLSSREPRSWAQAMAVLLDDPDTRSRLSETARLHALGFTWGTTATALMGVYGNLLA